MELVKFTEAQERKLAELVQQKERAEASKAEFLRLCRKEKPDVLRELKAVPEEELRQANAKISELQKLEKRVNEVCEKYGCTVDELIEYISSERQTNYYINTHMNRTLF